MMAVCSAVGQLFIFHTIKRYGPLVFATIQTVRQLLSIVLSILFFGQPINLPEAAGIALVFVTLAYQIYAKYQARKQAEREKAQQDKEHTPVPLLPVATPGEPADGSEHDLHSGDSGDHDLHSGDLPDDLDAEQGVVVSSSQRLGFSLG